MNKMRFFLITLMLTFPLASFARTIESGKFLLGFEDVASRQALTMSTDEPGYPSRSRTISFIGYSTSGMTLGYLVAPNIAIGMNIARISTDTSTYGIYRAMTRIYLPVASNEKVSGLIMGAYGRIVGTSTFTSSLTGVSTTSTTSGTAYDIGGGFAFQPIAGASIDFTLRYLNGSSKDSDYPYTDTVSGTILGVAVNVMF